MSRWRMLDNWDRDVPGLTDDQLRERHRMAREFEQSSDARGSGRNPKARRDWRRRREVVEAEMERRQLP